MEKPLRKVIDIWNIYPNPDFGKLFNRRSREFVRYLNNFKRFQKKAITLAKKLHDLAIITVIEFKSKLMHYGLLGNYFFDIAKIYESQRKFDESIDFMEQALNIATELEHYEDQIRYLSNLAIIYKKIGDLPEYDRLWVEAEKIMDRINH